MNLLWQAVRTKKSTSRAMFNLQNTPLLKAPRIATVYKIKIFLLRN